MAGSDRHAYPLGMAKYDRYPWSRPDLTVSPPGYTVFDPPCPGVIASTNIYIMYVVTQVYVLRVLDQKKRMRVN